MTLFRLFRLCGYYLKDLITNKKEDRIFLQWKEISEILSSYKTGWPQVEKSLQNCLKYATTHIITFVSKKTVKPFTNKVQELINKLSCSEKFPIKFDDMLDKLEKLMKLRGKGFLSKKV